MFAVRNYQQGVQRLCAACDEELLDTHHREGRFRLDVPRTFYDGQRVEAETLLSYLRSATVANLVGERTVALAIEHGFVLVENVLRVEGVPHAQFLVMEEP